jgi:hypothetical protein
MSISTLAQSVLIDDITDVVTTAIVQDLDTGKYVREVRIFGTPSGVGVPKPQVYVLRLLATERSSLEITVPESAF